VHIGLEKTGTTPLACGLEIRRLRRELVVQNA